MPREFFLSPTRSIRVRNAILWLRGFVIRIFLTPKLRWPVGARNLGDVLACGNRVPSNTFLQ